MKAMEKKILFIVCLALAAFLIAYRQMIAVPTSSSPQASPSSSSEQDGSGEAGSSSAAAVVIAKQKKRIIAPAQQQKPPRTSARDNIQQQQLHLQQKEKQVLGENRISSSSFDAGAVALAQDSHNEGFDFDSPVHADANQEERENTIFSLVVDDRSKLGLAAATTTSRRSGVEGGNNEEGDSGCGTAISKQFGLAFTVEREFAKADRGGAEYTVIIAQTAGNTSDFSWSARAVVGDSVLVGAPAKSLEQSSEAQMKAILARWEFVFWLPAPATAATANNKGYDDPSPGEEGGDTSNDAAAKKKSTTIIEITLSWINDLYVGQRWKLPNRDDNPSPEEKKRKCLALQLVGSCQRFGVNILTVKARHHHQQVVAEGGDDNGKINANNKKRKTKSGRRPLCASTEAVASNGAWHRITPKQWEAFPKQSQELLDDFVGLNRFPHRSGADGIWRWSPRFCSLRWFTREDALKLLTMRGIRQVTLFGDSMVLEQFTQLKKLLEPSARLHSQRQSKLRSMTFSTMPTRDAPAITVSFLRSYTTSGGQSVIANPNVVTTQVLRTKPDLIVGNAAVLHWQQNMRSLRDWTNNIRTIAKRLCRGGEAGIHKDWSAASEKTNVNRKKPNLFYWGPQLIQMGRTQGLQPQRTWAFGEAARVAFEEECGSISGAGLIADRISAFASMFNASIARRESAHDGQHWACYKEFGGVAATLTQMFLNAVLN